ncbi:uncharacterized protein LOC126779897 [Nymphalis io]|uniref:uncharacterized protein LOC126779897 n=1 Tax=Inachis io TaxID=171585 RepID=UPI0021699F40|nr:uncharacterized protein LOC126779897 [Nymphalis io]
MVEKAEIKAESLLNLDDLLQCPVCYEIPSGQIFQCNEGHHVCGRCKMRLDVCPVCRALFFGTRNYAMEELIANFRKLRAFKLGSHATAGTGSSESSTPAKETTTGECENDANDEEENNPTVTNEPAQRPPQACKGLFRCLCCKNGNGERLPSARLLNHLRYFHAPDLLEGRSENGEYLQAWQFSTVPGKLVTAVRVSDMGIFFLTIEINSNSVYAWLTMAAAPWVAHAFNYTVTICGNDREAIFSDCVWSVRSCEGSLKKRGNCLVVREMDARALTAPAMISGKLSVRRTPPDQLANQSQPRAVLRIANRSNNQNNSNNLEPFLQDLQNDVARLSRAFAMLGQEANALVRSEAEIRARIENSAAINPASSGGRTVSSEAEPQPTVQNDQILNEQALSRNARRRIRQRLRAALNGPNPLVPPSGPLSHNVPILPVPPSTLQRRNGPILPMSTLSLQRRNGPIPPVTTMAQQRSNEPFPPVLPMAQQRRIGPMPPVPPPAPQRRNGPMPPVPPPAPQESQRHNGYSSDDTYSVYTVMLQAAPAPSAPPPQPVATPAQPVAPATQPVAPPSSSSGPSQPQPPPGNGTRNKKKRRHRR